MPLRETPSQSDIGGMLWMTYINPLRLLKASGDPYAQEGGEGFDKELKRPDSSQDIVY